MERLTNAFQPVAEVAGPPVAEAADVSLLARIIPIFLVEALILRVMKWGTWRDSLPAALAMNFVSTLAGFFLLFNAVPDLTVVFVGFVLSVALEGG